MDRTGVIFWAVVIVIGFAVWALFGGTGVLVLAVVGFVVLLILLAMPHIYDASQSYSVSARKERAQDKPKLEAYTAQVKQLWESGDEQLAATEVQALTLSTVPALHGDGKGKVIAHILSLRPGGAYRPAGVLNRDHIMIELAGADLSGLKLRGDYQLSEASLHDVDLSDAYLSNVFLNQADLHGANLHGAKLIRVSFNEADLTGADLSGADLHHSHLFGADFSGANLQGADLQEALGLEEANLRGALYDGDTRWPEEFEPAEYGAVRG